ncbi:hypothetical protein N9Y00_08050 [Tateyamaria sp.]|nr:hypothetical protein [Tateyamaria sp.]
MDPQTLIDVLSEQRNSALNQAAQATAYASGLETRCKELEAKLTDLSPSDAPPEEEEVKD